jgi:hypothetical protein
MAVTRARATRRVSVITVPAAVSRASSSSGMGRSDRIWNPKAK